MFVDNNQDGNTWKWADKSAFIISPIVYNNLPGGILPSNRPGQMDCLTIYTGNTVIVLGIRTDSFVQTV